MKRAGLFTKTVVAASAFLAMASAAALAGPVSRSPNPAAKEKISTAAPCPHGIVSLLPAATEILFALGSGEAVQGLTYASADLPGAAGKQIVGGFFHPSVDRIKALDPDAIFYAPIHEEVEATFAGTSVRMVRIDIGSIEEGLGAIERIGGIVQRQKEAEKIIETIRANLLLVRKKTERIAETERLRVLRIMGTDPLMVPGDGSFQNQMIRAAGGIPPVLGKTGPAVAMSKEEWVRFDPQVLYGCNGGVRHADPLFSMPGWRDVEAVQKGILYDFPCDLTCRAGIRTADFVSWLSARLYEDIYAQSDNLVLAEKVVKNRLLPLAIEYVDTAQVAESRIWDFVNKTLLVDFSEPMAVLSTLEGTRENIETVGNHYASPPLWKIAYGGGVEPVRNRVLSVIERPAASTALLFTGADMDHMAAAAASFKDLSVTALVTAGACANAMRMGKDTGGYYEPGTINILLLPGVRLTARAMNRAVITATEAKTAALLDLDVRSTYSGSEHRATGTGTDNIIVAQGRGLRIDNTGGHSKMGDLIARAVYNGVREALSRQNGLHAGRSVFRRLKERDIDLFELLSESSCECIVDKGRVLQDLEEVLLVPRYAAFLLSSFSLSDEVEKGLIPDLSAFRDQCRQIAQELSQTPGLQMDFLVPPESLPLVIEEALNALLNGVRKGR
ncbi:MAG: adenosylcobinamide amidohydrolase [Desulfobacterales bacterium]|nr:adenosylcobinamide amidohydrolase [Desulfobacterales bacterium]